MIYVISVITELTIGLVRRAALVKLRYFGHYRNMDQEHAIEAFGALAQATRMSIFRLLVRAGPDGMQAGEVSRRLEVVTSTLSGHLAVLKRAGLLTATRHQREIHYAADMRAVNDLVGFLLSDCCEGQVDNCSAILSLLEAE